MSTNEEAILVYINNFNENTPEFIRIAIFKECIKQSCLKGLEKIISSKMIDPSMDNNSAMRHAIDNNDNEMIKILMHDERVDLFVNFYKLFHDVCRKKNIEMVKFLLNNPKFDPSNIGYFFLYNAANEGNYKIAKLLLDCEKKFLDGDYNSSLRAASTNGHIEIVKLMLNSGKVDPSNNNNIAIQVACQKGHIDIVKLLLSDKRVNQCDNNNDAIIGAVENGHEDIVKLLIPYVDLSTIKNKKIHKIVNKMKPPSGSGNWYEELNSLMDKYQLKSVSFEGGKMCNVTFNS